MAETPSDQSSRESRIDDAIARYLELAERGHPPDQQEYIAQHPDLAAELQSFFADRAQFQQLAGELAPRGATIEPKPDNQTPASPTPVSATPGHLADPSPATMAWKDRSRDLHENVVRYFGDYELLEEIARGGMGVVFKARQTSLNRIVAVKMILSGQLASPEDVQRFQTEAEAAAQLDHPGIVPIYEVGVHEGQHYFAMGFVEGASLAARVAQGPLPPREAAEIVREVAVAVQYAHDHGVIHRDLKPGNVLLDRDGKPRVTDFGLAKLIESGSDLTGTGQILGTPSYMPPEQAAAQVSAVSRLSDVYSLGAVLYCLLTGRPPFQAANPLETLLQVQKQEPVAPCQLNPNLPLDLDTIVLKCLDKSPTRRYASAKALAEELQHYLNGRPILARPVGRLERFRRWCRREPMVAGLSAAVAAALVVGATVSAYFAVNESKRATSEARARKNEEIQRRIADKLKVTAVAAGKQAKKAQENAQVQAELTRQKARELRHALYLWDMKRIEEYARVSNAELIGELLNRHIPQSTDEEDLRDFAWRLQWTELFRNARVLKGHDDGARLAAFAPDGQLVTLDGGLALQRWNPALGTNVSTVRLPMVSHVSHWAISADARFVALAAGDTVHIIDASTGKTLRTLPRPALVLGLAFSSDGNKLAAVWGAGGAVLWDLAIGAESAPFHLPEMEDYESVQAIGLAPDGQSMYLLGYPHGKQITHLWAGNAAPAIYDDPSTIYSLALTADGRRAAIGDANGQVSLWNTATDEQEGNRLKVHHGTVSALAFSSDGARLATGGDDGIVTVWDVENRDQVATYKGHRGRIHALAFGPDGRFLASASADGDSRIWSLAQTSMSRVFGSHALPVFSVAFSGDGQRLAVGTGSGEEPPGGVVKVWEYPSARLAAEFRAAEGRVLGLAFTVRDGNALVSGGYDSMLRLWDVASSRELREPLTGQIAGPPSPSHQAIGTLAVSPDGKFAAAGFGLPTYHHPDYDQVAKVWNLATWQEQAVLPGHSNNIPSVAFSRNGKLLATAGDDQQVKLWSTRDWSNIRTLTGTERFKSVVFSPDDQWVATGSESGTITLWESASGRLLRQLRGHASAVQHLAFSPDGRTLASASWDNTVKLWEPISGREMRTLRDHDDWISCLAFSPDGNTLATGSFDKSVRLWEAASLAEISASVAEDQALDDHRTARQRLRQEARSVRRAISLDATGLERYTGIFGRGLTVHRKDEHLTIQPIRGAQGLPIEIYPESEKEFFCRNREIDVSFLQDDQAHVIRLIVHQNGRSFSARKLGEGEQ